MCTGVLQAIGCPYKFARHVYINQQRHVGHVTLTAVVWTFRNMLGRHTTRLAWASLVYGLEGLWES